MVQGLSVADWAVVGLYFFIILLVVLWSRWKGRNEKTPGQYFLAGKNVGWVIIGASLFASNIGSEHLVGLAGSGATRGVAVAQFEVLAGFILLLLGWVFVPFYLRSGVYTMPEFLERRYSGGPRLYLAIISIAGYVLTKISVTVAAGGIVFETLMGIDFWTGALITVVATGLYTALGGLRTVLYTDFVQLFVLLAGSIAVTVLGLEAVGGWGALKEAAGAAHFDIWKPSSDPDYPWTGILFGAPILAVWYWCTDQFIVQRVLSARNETAARRGTIFAGFLKMLPLFIFVIPGVIAFVLAQSGRLELARNDNALPALVGALLPSGLKGLVAAGLLAALMSSLSSVFNSCSTLFTMDIYRRWHPTAGPRTLVVVGQVAVIVLVALGLAWIPFMSVVSGQLFTYVQSVQSYISPPIAAVFLLGILWPRANSRGAVAALSVGFVLGLGRLILEINKAHLSGIAFTLADTNFLHVAILLFLVCCLTLVVVSSLTAAPDRGKLTDLTYATLKTPIRFARMPKSDMVLSALLVAAIAAIWIYFRG